MTGDPWTIATARVALVLYVAALIVLLRGASARALWSAGMLAYLAHVAAAFHFVHGWSHEAALAETARQSRALFGIDSGFGLWFNYLFTAVWGADAAWWWIDEHGYGRRRRWISVTVHAFIAFMFFNGAVVFADGPSRWIGLMAIVVLPVLWLRGRRSR